MPIVTAKDYDYAVLEKNLIQYQNKIQSLQQSLDRSIFDDQQILIQNDFDAEIIVAFVQDKIAFQPYVGLLRGVQGTLNSRAGNSLDQSVLLAKLLKDAGFEARIANTQLTKEQSLSVLLTTANGIIPENIGQGEEFEKALKSLNKPQNTKETKDWNQTETYARFETSLNQLNQILKQNQIDLSDKDITQNLIEKNQDYFWVQYRMSVTEPWNHAHPVWNKTPKPELKATHTFKDQVPQKYLHKVRIEAFIEQRIGDKYKTHSLMKPWESPAANLQDVYLSYSNAPSAVELESDYDFEKIINKTNTFVPTFNDVAVGGKVFDLQGRLIDSMAMASPTAGIFKTVGDKTLLAVDAVEGNNKTTMQLTAQWLEFTFIHPDGIETKHRRYIYKAGEGQKQSEKSIKTDLLSEYQLMINTGEQPLAYLADLYLKSVNDSLPLLKASVKKLFSEDKKAAFPKSFSKSAFDLLIQYFWMNQNPKKDKNVVSFRNQANLISFKKGFIDTKTAYFAVDIINNSKQFIHIKDSKLYNSTKQSIIQGVWDTACEWLPAKINELEGNKLDTLKVVSAAQQQDISMKLIQPKVKAQTELNLIFKKETLAYQSIKSDLDNGYMVIVPNQKPDKLKMSGWWRINPTTGETLGMTADGGGQEITEYMIEHAQIALMLVRSLSNLQKCEMDNSLNNFEKMCCLAEAHFNNVVGLSFGGVLAAQVGTAGAAVFDIVDFTHELATGSGIAPSTNGEICKAVGPIPDF
jgi:hypothetical protein